MRKSSSVVKSEIQPPLFGGAAAAITAQALVDPEAQTVVFTCEVLNPTTGKLEAYWSTAEIDWSSQDAGILNVLKEFKERLWEHTSPFV